MTPKRGARAGRDVVTDDAQDHCLLVDNFPRRGPIGNLAPAGSAIQLKETSSAICSRMSARGSVPLMSSRMRLRFLFQLPLRPWC